MFASDRRFRIGKLIIIGFLVASSAQSVSISAETHGYYRVDFFSDVPGERAFRTDPGLVNPWGMAFSPKGPVWIADNGSGLSTVYSVRVLAQKFPGQAQPLIVKIPPPPGRASGTTATPTGAVFNGTSDFVVSDDGAWGPSLFIFATEDGTLCGWSFDVAPFKAVLTVDNSAGAVDGSRRGAVYKGIALGNNGSGNFIYVTNFRDKVVEAYDTNFNFVGFFTDSNVVKDPFGPAQEFAPFGIRNINGRLYVTFAMQDADQHDNLASSGSGIVDVFDLNGNLIKTLTSGGTLNSPWGMVLAPASFGRFSKDLLIGNFGDGRINAFDPATGAFHGQVFKHNGAPIVIRGLWALEFGNGGLGGRTNDLLFTAGIQGKFQGLFGRISALGH